MKAFSVRTIVLTLAVALTGCTTTSYPTQVTRFHAGEPIIRGRIAIQPFDAPPGSQGARGPEFDLYAAAIEQQLTRLGWTVVRGSGPVDQVALIGLDERTFSSREQSPVSIGVGGGTGGWSGGGVGGGLGFDLGGGQREMVSSTLSVRIKRSADEGVFWEGRASVTARADRPEGSPSALAPRLADALFQGFPGESGRTIRLP